MLPRMHGTPAHALEPSLVLRMHGFRVSPKRIRLLQHLAHASEPLSIREIRARWRGAPDQATLYRSLSDLADAGIVQRADLNTGVAHFEYSPLKPHHHHVVCVKCGVTEDVELCPPLRAPKTKKFQAILSHNLEFSGICRHCAQAV
jgi:Fur family zinc uptake transcriptional regulator